MIVRKLLYRQIVVMFWLSECVSKRCVCSYLCYRWFKDWSENSIDLLLAYKEEQYMLLWVDTYSDYNNPFLTSVWIRGMPLHMHLHKPHYTVMVLLCFTSEVTSSKAQVLRSMQVLPGFPNRYLKLCSHPCTLWKSKHTAADYMYSKCIFLRIL